MHMHRTKVWRILSADSMCAARLMSFYCCAIPIAEKTQASSPISLAATAYRCYNAYQRCLSSTCKWIKEVSKFNKALDVMVLLHCKVT